MARGERKPRPIKVTTPPKRDFKLCPQCKGGVRGIDGNCTNCRRPV